MSTAPTIEQSVKAELGEMTYQIVKLRNALMVSQVEIAKRDREIKQRDETIMDLKGQLSATLEKINGPELPLPAINGAANGKHH